MERTESKSLWRFLHWQHHWGIPEKSERQEMNSIQTGWVKSCVHEAVQNMYVTEFNMLQESDFALSTKYYCIKCVWFWRIFLKSSHGTKVSSVPYVSTSVVRPEWQMWAATALLPCVELSVWLWAVGGRSCSRKQHLHGIETTQECKLHLQSGITDTTCSHILPKEIHSMNLKEPVTKDLIQTLHILLPL